MVVLFLEAFGMDQSTNMRSNAGPDGKKMGETKRKHSKNSVDVDVCAEKIIQAIMNKKRYIPWKLELIPLLDMFAGNYLEEK